MKTNPTDKAEKFKTVFQGYQPNVKMLGSAQGGGYRVSFDVSEDDWNSIKELNSPTNQGKIFTVLVQGDTIS